MGYILSVETVAYQNLLAFFANSFSRSFTLPKKCVDQNA